MSALLRLYVIRGLIAISWVVGFATFLDSLAVAAIIFLVVYPLIDVVALLIDFAIGLFDIGVSTLAAIAPAIAGTLAVASVLEVFGAWVIAAGRSSCPRQPAARSSSSRPLRRTGAVVSGEYREPRTMVHSSWWSGVVPSVRKRLDRQC